MSEQYADYELLRHIATGGMAEIHLARRRGQGATSPLLVLKRMLPQLAVRPDFVTMFLDEARLSSTLVHPNLVRVFELGQHEGSYFLTMELVDGPHLGALFAHSLRARAPLPIDLCCWVVARAADGLHYAHDRNDPATGTPLNLVHRDISPQNILVGRYGDVKVADFGVAKATTQQTKTRTGIIKGKVAYMSPEQCLGDTIDRRTDVFALGIVLYELITRRRLFHHLKSDLLVMQEITSKDIAPASTVNPQVDPQLDAIVGHALARDVSQRFESAAELAAALDAWGARRTDARILATWFEANCLALAPSLAPVSGPAPFVVTGSIETSLPAQERTTATPSMPELAVAGGPRPLPEKTVITAPPSPPSTLPMTLPMTLPSSLPPPSPPGGGGALLPTVGRLSDDPLLDASAEDTQRVPFVAEPRRSVVSGPRRAVVVGLGAAALVGIAAGVVLGPLRGSDPPAVVLAPPSPSAPVAAQERPPVGRVRIETTPSGATILVGESRVLGRSPVEVELPPGPVRLQAQFADQPPRSTEAEVKAGETIATTIHAWVPLSVQSMPPRAKVRIDGELRGETPFEQGFLVEPGKAVSVRVEAPGFAPWEEQRTAVPGAPLEVVVKLVPAVATLGVGAPARDDFGAIRVNVDPWAIVKLGDVVLGEAPFNDKRVRAGRQLLTLTNPEVGLKDAFPVVIPADKTLVVILRYEKRGAAWVLAQKNIR